MKWWVCEKPGKAPGLVGRRGQLSRILCFDWSPVLPRSEKWSFRSCHSVMRGRNFEWQHLPRAKYFFRDEPCSRCCIVFLHQIRLTMDQKRAKNGPKRPPPLRKLYLAENILQFGVKICQTVFFRLSYDLSKLKNILFCGKWFVKEN